MKKVLLPFSILVLCAGFFSSCDKEEEDDENNVPEENNIPEENKNDGQNENSAQQKRLATMSYNNGASFTFEFDSDGRLKSLIGSNVFNSSGKEEYDYVNQSLIATYGGESITGTLNADGTLSKVESKSQTMEYTYGQSKQLASLTHTQIIDSDNKNSISFRHTWENGNIVSTIMNQGGKSNGAAMELEVRNLNFKYTNDKYPTPIENKGGLLLSFYHATAYLSFVNGTGAACKNLPVSIDNGTGSYVDVEYTFDEDGYPTKLIFNNTTIDYTWN